MNNFIKSQTTKNLYAKEWETLEKNKKIPSIYKKVVFVEYKEFIEKILKQEPKFVKEIVGSLYSGNMFIIKNALSKKTVDHIINEVHMFTKSVPSKFHKMIEGVPNFHRWIGKDLVDSYSIKYTKHSIHMFAWNNDIADVRKIIMEVCRPIKLLSGLSMFEFEKNTPKDLIVERLQIARYPPTGFIEPHIDANTLMRLVISGYLSTRSIDYKKGGFYFVGKNDEKQDIENQIRAGDIGLFYPSIRHGLEVIDPDKDADINKTDGRWWFGLNVHNSDEMKSSERQTTSPYKIQNCITQKN